MICAWFLFQKKGTNHFDIDIHYDEMKIMDYRSIKSGKNRVQIKSIGPITNLDYRSGK